MKKKAKAFAFGPSGKGFAGALALCLTFGLVSCGNAFSEQADVTQIETVTTMTALNAAVLKATPGSAIEVAPGNYPFLEIKGVGFDQPITIRSAEEARPATFEGFSIRNSNNINLQNLAIRPKLRMNEPSRYGAIVLKSKNIGIDAVSFVGPLIGPKKAYNMAIMLRLSRNISLTRSYFANFRHGVGMLELNGSRIALNEFERLQTDAIRGGGVSGIRIENNVITNFSPAPGDHPDGIQLWSTNQRDPGRDIVIAENLVARGQGDPIQGIFIRDTFKELPFEDIEVRRNLVLGGLYNGISVNGVEKLLVRDNTVIGRSDQKSWIRIQRSRDARSSSNIAQQFLSIDNGVEPQQTGNSEVAPLDSGQAQVISQWIENTRGFAEYRGPVLRRLMAGD